MILKHGFKTMGSIIVAAVISFFLCLSLLNICTALFTSEVGYKAFVYESETSDKLIDEYVYYYVDNDGDGKDDGTDTKMQEYEDKGYSVVTSKERSNLSGAGKTIFYGCTQLLSALMIIAFASNGAYKQGFKDSNLVRIGHIKQDKLKGFKIGLIANIPFFVIFVIAIVKASAFRTTLYAFLNSHYYALIMIIADGKATLSGIGFMQYILLAAIQFIVPVVSGVAYIIGLKEINLGEKIVYEKEGK